MRGDAMVWPLRIGLVALCAVVPWLAGPGYVIALLLALPVLRALLDGMREHWVARVCVLGGCAAAVPLVPPWLISAVVVWGLGLLAMSLLPVPPGRRTIRASAVHAVCTAVTALALASARWGGSLISGLAQTLIDRIDASPNSAITLLSAYRLGLARLEGDLALIPTLGFFNPAILPDVRQQLLFSLRTSLETLLQAYIPRGVMTWMLLTALLPALAAECYLRSRNRRSDLPSPRLWHIPNRMTSGITLLLLLGLLPYVSGSPVLGLAGTMCNTLALGACAVQGASFLADFLARRSIRPLLCGLIVALITAMLPTALFFFGIYDQFLDPRHLRGSQDETV